MKWVPSKAERTKFGVVVRASVGVPLVLAAPLGDVPRLPTAFETIALYDAKFCQGETVDPYERPWLDVDHFFLAAQQAPVSGSALPRTEMMRDTMMVMATTSVGMRRVS